MFCFKEKNLGDFDIAVCGGGVAGTAAAIIAGREGAKVVVIEKAGCLGGTLTDAFMPNILDSENKGGFVKEIYDFLNEHQMTCARRGKKTDETGKRIPGCLVDTEGIKYFFDKECEKAGVTVLYNSMLVSADHNSGHINKLLVATQCGNYTLSAKVYVDATGSGALSDLVGCKGEYGDPEEGRISPSSMSLCMGGMPDEFNGTDSHEAKTEYGNMLKENGIEISAEQAGIAKLPNLKTWSVGFNFEYDIVPDDIVKYSKAIANGREEAFETVEKHKQIKGYESVYTAFTGSTLGIREGRRIFGEYRITNEDILEGKKFDDGICLVTAGVDVHKLKSDDTTECQRGVYTKPYHIPYRALLPKDSDNIILAGRCISGDFYPFSSYRMMGNMFTVGEAAGYAAALCIKENKEPKSVDGTLVKAFISRRGHEL